MRIIGLLFVLLTVLSGCAAPTPSDSPLADGRSVERTRLPDVPVPPVPPPEVPGVPAPPAAPAAPAIEFPPNTQYVCVVDHGGVRKVTAIEFAPKVASLCNRHPEMGPCQYERNMCRSTGGRVYAANGEEITMATEAEYDKKVLRVRFKAS